MKTRSCIPLLKCFFSNLLWPNTVWSQHFIDFWMTWSLLNKSSIFSNTLIYCCENLYCGVFWWMIIQIEFSDFQITVFISLQAHVTIRPQIKTTNTFLLSTAICKMSCQLAVARKMYVCKIARINGFPVNNELNDEFLCQTLASQQIVCSNFSFQIFSTCFLKDCKPDGLEIFFSINNVTVSYRCPVLKYHLKLLFEQFFACIAVGRRKVSALNTGLNTPSYYTPLFFLIKSFNNESSFKFFIIYI